MLIGWPLCCLYCLSQKILQMSALQHLSMQPPQEGAPPSGSTVQTVPVTPLKVYLRNHFDSVLQRSRPTRHQKGQVMPRQYGEVLTEDEVYERIAAEQKEKSEKQAKKATTAKKGTMAIKATTVKRAQWQRRAEWQRAQQQRRTQWQSRRAKKRTMERCNMHQAINLNTFELL